MGCCVCAILMPNCKKCW